MFARCSRSSSKPSLKELQSLAAKADALNVDVSEERRQLDAYIERASEWLKKARAAMPVRAKKILRGSDAVQATSDNEKIQVCFDVVVVAQKIENGEKTLSHSRTT